jgi:hypothetical protein
MPLSIILLSCLCYAWLLLYPSIGHIFDLVDPHNPVFGCVSLLQNVELKVLVSNFGVSNAVKAWRLACNRTKRGLLAEVLSINKASSTPDIKFCLPVYASTYVKMYYHAT